ncbi:MAG: hypothetical protein ISR51_08850 [Rhodospirillales bacterium]|nr:hypothetical protein [Alphaproteobacteria bacterium]MBL6948771.1 hypothetical protein [Rhodospirillales bacterium]
MNESPNIYYIIGPLLIFGPLFLWILYNLGVRELFRIPGDIRRQRQREAEDANRFREEHARKRGTGLSGGVKDANITPLGLFAQAVTYIWFAAVIGFFAAQPPYTYNPSGDALLKLSLSHPGKRKVECRRRSAQELAKLAANMRAPNVCSRERWPVYVEIEIDGDIVFRKSARPNGLSKDGPSIFYIVRTIKAGEHVLAMRLRERTRDKEGNDFDFEKNLPVTLKSGQVLAVEFHAAKGGFVVQ